MAVKGGGCWNAGALAPSRLRLQRGYTALLSYSTPHTAEGNAHIWHQYKRSCQLCFLICLRNANNSPSVPNPATEICRPHWLSRLTTDDAAPSLRTGGTPLCAL